MRANSARMIVGVATGLGIFSSLTAYNYVTLFFRGQRPFYFLLALNITGIIQNASVSPT